MVLTSTTGTTSRSPRHDDVLIGFRNSRWEVGVASTPPSISCSSREAAMRIAQAFATVHGVDVWLSHGASCECIVGARATRKPVSGGKSPARSTTTSLPATP